MPSAKDLLKKMDQKKFVKKDRRPWDYDVNVAQEETKEIKDTNKTEQKLPKKSNVIKKAPEKKESAVKLDNLETNNNIEDNLSEKGNSLNQYNAIKNKIVESTDVPKLKVEFDDHNEYLQLTRSIKSLVGIQRKIFFLIFKDCLKSNSLNTIAYSVKEIQQILQVSSVGTVNMSLERLVKKNLIKRFESKKGRGGYLNLGFEQKVWDACLSIKNELEELS